jgi:hypothetical protein
MYALIAQRADSPLSLGPGQGQACEPDPRSRDVAPAGWAQKDDVARTIPTAPVPAGRGAWIWYVNKIGSAEEIVRRAREAQLTHVYVKAADGGEVWGQLTRKLIDNLHAAGLGVYGWGYNYLDDPAAEANAARHALGLGLDGWVADVEAECRGKWRQAEAFARAVRFHCGDRLFAYAPLPVIDLHTSLPYLQFNRVCDVVMPQMYTNLLGSHWTLETLFAIWDRWTSTWASWGEIVPTLAPLGETFGHATPADIEAFERACRARSLTAWSFWEMGQATPEQWEAVGAIDRHARPGIRLTGDARAEVIAATDGIWHSTTRLARWEHVAEAEIIQRQVDRIKQALTLPPFGDQP